jgi:hypothetical protein
MYNSSGQKYKDTVELKLKWSTKIYHNKTENISIRFDNAYFMFLEQRMKEDTLSNKKTNI